MDLFAGIVTVSVGHCHPRVNQVLIDQAQNLWHTTQIYWYEGIHSYAKQLADKLPEGLDCGEFDIFFEEFFSSFNDFTGGPLSIPIMFSRVYIN